MRTPSPQVEQKATQQAQVCSKRASSKKRHAVSDNLTPTLPNLIIPDSDVTLSPVHLIPSPFQDTWREWLRLYFAASTRAGFSERHEQFWEWVWAMAPGQRPRPFVAIWPRGGGKSSSSELAVVALGVRGVRRYCLYVCETQAQADDHVAGIAGKLERLGIQRKLSRYGQSQGWRRNRLRSENFTVDALGLDVASRGKKIDDDRPDLVIFDDVDNQADSPKMVAKKKKILTSAILPAMASGGAVLFCQNLIHANSIAAQLCDGRADFLIDRIVSGPHKAAENLVVEAQATEYDGKFRIRHLVRQCSPTWAGQDAFAIQEAIDTYGLRDFLSESQHDVYEREGALWSRALLSDCYIEKAPPLRRVVVAIDPSGGGDEIGIVAAGLGHDGRAYVLADRSIKGSLGPLAWGRAGVELYHELRADRIVGEGNFGGDMVKSNILVADPRVPVFLVHASRGKAMRAEPVAALYGRFSGRSGEDGARLEPTRVFHVGVFAELETEQTTWTPDESWSPNRLDALVWALSELMLGPGGAQKRSRSFSFSG